MQFAVPDTSTRRSRFTSGRSRTGTLFLLVLCTAAIIAALVVTHVISMASLRDNALKSAEGYLSSRSLTLAEQADRAIQTVDLLLGTLAEHLERSGVVDSASYTEKMSGRETHLLLREKIKTIPQIDAVTMIDRNGKLINFSRYWPIPEVNISDRDYYKALSTDASLVTFISRTVQNRGDWSWNIYFARRVNGPNGEFIGLILGAMAAAYFEDFYRAIMPNGDGVALYRADGTPLVRFQNGDPALTELPDPSRSTDMVAADGTSAAPHLTHLHDGAGRLVSVRKLRNYPLLVVGAQTEEAALAGIREIERIALFRLTGAIVLVVLAAGAIGLWFRTHDRAAAADLARAGAEAELLRHQERAAEAASQAKSSFLATMSHEIRTPMNALLGLATSLLDSPLDADQRADLLAMQRAGDELLRILNDILDFSKLEAGKFQLENAPFSPATLTEHAVGIVALRAKEKQLVVRTDDLDRLPPAVVGDQGRIRQVLLNLLSNAIKFTEAGEVRVTVDVLACDATAATLRWHVSDTGIGIVADKLSELFHEFVQADTSINGRFGGTGLGLAICRRIIEQMNGKIWADSAPGRGSTFCFELAFPIGESSVQDATAQPAPIADLHGAIARLGRPAMILLAEDNVTNQVVTSRMLREFDCHMAIVPDGRQAIAAAERTAYDVILMDVRMPDIDGLAAARAIRAKGGRLGGVPIIAITANAFADDIAACHAAGMTIFVPKPTRKRELVAALARALTEPPAAPPTGVAAGHALPDSAGRDIG